MKVEVIKDFNDLQEKKSRKVGDIFECTLDRATFLSNHNVVVILLDDEKEVEQTPLEQWAVIEEEDGNVHVRPVIDGEIIDTPVEKVEDYSKKNKKKKGKK